jgi:hypothetical protein
MSYIYSKINRLEEPHNYMYTPYHGAALLQSYESSRMEVINRFITAEYQGLEQDKLLMSNVLPVLNTFFTANSCEYGKKFQTLLEDSGVAVSCQSKNEHDNLNALSMSIGELTIAESISTVKLLHILISIFLTDSQNSTAKIWLDRLVQRFEVTKKIYESYLPGFRKGEGDNKSVRLYWLFALALSLFYIRSKEIKYLSTLLKVNDLLCSLSEDILQNNIPQHGLPAVLATELHSVQSLSDKKGISFAFN